jgi:hypothetical protein
VKIRFLATVNFNANPEMKNESIFAVEFAIKKFVTGGGGGWN